MSNKPFVGGTLAAIVLVSAWAGIGPAAAGAQDAGPQYSIAVAGVPGCDTTSGDAVCDLALDSTFVVDVTLESLPSNVPQYTGIDIRLAHSGVTPQGVPSFDPWPDCAYPAELARADNLLFGCAIGIAPAEPSSYTGLVATMTFSCRQSGTVGLVHGKQYPSVTDADEHAAHAESADATETLTINCVAGGAMPPTPTQPEDRGPTIAPAGITEEPAGQVTATAPAGTQATAATSTPPSGEGEGDGGGGLNGGVIAIVVVVAVAVAGGLGLLGWRLLRSRRGTGGGT